MKKQIDNSHFGWNLMVDRYYLTLAAQWSTLRGQLDNKLFRQTFEQMIKSLEEEI